jgi:hypothetical protein
MRLILFVVLGVVSALPEEKTKSGWPLAMSNDLGELNITGLLNIKSKFFSLYRAAKTNSTNAAWCKSKIVCN